MLPFFGGSVEEIHGGKTLEQTPGHPAFVFLKENDGLLSFLDGDFTKAVKAYKKENTLQTRADLLAALKSLSKLDNHYSRKENLLFPYLEKKPELPRLQRLCGELMMK